MLEAIARRLECRIQVDLARLDVRDLHLDGAVTALRLRDFRGEPGDLRIQAGDLQFTRLELATAGLDPTGEARHALPTVSDCPL